MRRLNILISCEESGTMREAFRRLGHNAWSCDEKPSADNSPYHITGDVRPILSAGWDFLFGFPPCTYLCKAQMFRYTREPGRIAERDAALEFFRILLSAPVPFIALENPAGYLNTALRAPDQIIRPWWFGDPYHKEICLWLKDMPPLMATCINPKRKSISNHVNSRMSSAEVSHVRSSWKYFPKMAEQIAIQYSAYLVNAVPRSFGDVPGIKTVLPAGMASNPLCLNSFDVKYLNTDQRQPFTPP